MHYKRYPIEFTNDTKLLLIGGMWEGILHVLNTETDMLIDTYRHHNDTITALAVDAKGSKLITGNTLKLFTGTKAGECTLWTINAEFKLIPKLTFTDHTS